MKNSQKGFVGLAIIIIVALVLIGGGTYVYLNKGSSKPENIPVVNQTNSTLKVYRNSNLGYEISVQPNWHISEEMSKKFDTFIFTSNLYKSVGCDLETFAEMGGDATVVNQKLQDCLKKSPKLSEINSLYENFNKSWNVGNAQTIILTRLTSEEESKINKEIVSINTNWPQGSFIRVAPFDFKGDFATEISSSKAGLKRSFYFIGNDKTYLTDMRDTKISDGGISLSLPISSEKQLYTGEKIQSINFFSTVTKDSQDEKDFFVMVQSLKLIK
ncbi:MAG: hypothetical protein Q7K26_00335 [bacterium]|nr:hypothetical protein [bacterium]